ncbi:1-acyl-sn-glycerol-3-phosphate acyltransferase [Planctomonas sp. JC2975]|uniref:lysophospholipid acyltransferase family protein n=1 Tax=Planctomonas sp. JC2975 TaxID=2729626 RepID=UPI0017964C69|nr:1-acyl-sn-glycerol-3-phosphate acyltransferase [Planctomonas sp. JC2975]
MPKTPDVPDAALEPADRSPKKRRIRKETFRPSVFWVGAGIVVPLIGTISSFKVRGKENLPLEGSFVIAPNHYSEIDPLVVGSMLWRHGRQPRFLAKESLFKVPVVGWFLRSSGQVPVSRSHGGRGAPVAQAQHIVDEDYIVVVYPEGTLTRDPDLWPMRGKTGAARIALDYGIPVIPVAHWGTQQIMARYSKKISLFPRKKITFSIGKPVDLDAFRGKPMTATVLNEATETIMRAITHELEALRGEKAPEKRWDPSEHAQSETGRFEG